MMSYVCNLQKRELPLINLDYKEEVMKVKKFGHSNKIYDQEKIKSSFL